MTGIRVSPLFTTDGLVHYQTALLTHFGYWQRPDAVPGTFGKMLSDLAQLSQVTDKLYIIRRQRGALACEIIT